MAAAAALPEQHSEGCSGFQLSAPGSIGLVDYLLADPALADDMHGPTLGC